MASDAAIRLIGEATEALQQGDAEKTLRAAEQALVIDESVAQAHQLRGIALTRLERVEEATMAFRRATEVAPYEAKHFYNLAVNLRDRDLRDEATSMTLEAMRIEPRHAGARMLYKEMTGTEADEVEESAPEKPVVREGYGEPEHLLPWMYGMEKPWNAVAYGIMGVGLVLAISLIFNFPVGPTGETMKGSTVPNVDLKRDNLSVLQIFLYILANLFTFLWMFVDVVDRRKRFTWLVPFTVCGTFGFSVLPLAFYFFIGRKLESGGVSKP